MAYTRNPTWQDSPSVVTPITAATLNNLEGGLVTAAGVADGNTTAIAGKRTTALTRRDLPARSVWNPAVTSDAPTVTTTGPGGPGAAGLTQYIPYDQVPAARIGCLPVHTTALGSDYWQNQFIGQGGSSSTPWAQEFLYYGSSFQQTFRNNVGNGSWFWVWVDGSPATAAPVQSSAATPNSQFYIQLTWATTALRRVRIYVANADLGYLLMGTADTATATTKPPIALAVMGDSYITATGAADPIRGLGHTLGRILGVETYLGGAGGTGYVAPGSYLPYGDPARINPLGTVKPDYVLFFGSINDSGSTSAAVGSAASATFAAAAAVAPKSRLIVCTVQANSGTMSAANVANEAAIASAATAAGAIAVIRPIPEGWITGSGKTTAPTGTGNADVFVGPDGVHPSQAGHDYHAARIAGAVAAVLAA